MKWADCCTGRFNPRERPPPPTPVSSGPKLTGNRTRMSFRQQHEARVADIFKLRAGELELTKCCPKLNVGHNET
jgi:hypothetical protein